LGGALVPLIILDGTVGNYEADPETIAGMVDNLIGKLLFHFNNWTSADGLLQYVSRTLPLVIKLL